MSFINASLDFRRHALTESFYLGEVEDNNDPLMIGRVKVRIKEVHGTLSTTSELPWATPMRTTMFGGKSGLSWFSVPDVGSRIIVVFHKGDIYSPL